MEEQDEPITFVRELSSLINRYALDNLANTPDFILAAYLQNCLVDYAHAVNARDKSLGFDPNPNKKVGN